MVREALISAATLAGLVGLACLYNNGQSMNRVTREAEMLEEDIIALTEDTNQTDLDFLTDMGWLEEAAQADLPSEIIEDIKLYQEQEGKAGGGRKQIPQVKNCMKKQPCIDKAQESVARWSANSKQYITANPARLLKPINTNYASAGGEEDEHAGSAIAKDFNMCTPEDDAVPCEEGEDVLKNYNQYANSDPKNQFSAHPAVQSAIEDLADSTAMQNALRSMGASAPRDAGNAFSRRAAKVFLVVPNGAPFSMPESYQFRYGNYWRWFKNFNSRYLGVATPNGSNRVNTHFWFLRQDKVLKSIMKTPAKVSNRFPWRRFDQLMLNSQATAAQPKLTGTIQAIWETIDAKGMASEFNVGQDCATIWFHQYVPQDILDLSDSMFQEDYMKKLDSACTIIHVWVGFQQNQYDTDAVRVIQYIQGLLQPSQLSATSADPQMRRWYFIDDLEDLVGDAGKTLGDQIYNDIALERARATCLLATKGNDLGAVFEAANDRYDEYYSYQDGTTTVNAYAAETTAYGADGADYSLGYEADGTTTASFSGDTTTAGEPSIPDYRCCGIGYAAKKYDANMEACCDDGSTAASEADCFLL